MYLLALVSPMSMSSFSSSPCIFGAPQSGFSRLIARVCSRTSPGTVGRPGLPRRIFRAQNRRKPLRCHPTTVEACTTWMPNLRSWQIGQSHAHSARSAAVSFGRFTERCSTPIWWRSARISSWSSARLRNNPKNGSDERVNTAPNGNRSIRDNPQSINHIGICENHRYRRVF